MSFDFDKAATYSANRLKQSRKEGLLSVGVLGCQGAGKSYLTGTFGVKTLFIHGNVEEHGVESSTAPEGSQVVPMCYEKDDEGNPLGPDQALKRLYDILGSEEKLVKNGFKAIVLDSATELEALFRQTTKWKNACLTDKGKHNAFAEPAVTVQMFRDLIGTLKGLQDKIKLHYAITCILDVIAEDPVDGSVLESKPRLASFSVAEGLLQMLPDIVVVGPQLVNEDDEEKEYRLQFMAGVNRTSKDQNNRIKRTINFKPRLAGIQAGRLPNTAPADLSKVVEFKKKVLGGN